MKQYPAPPAADIALFYVPLAPFGGWQERLSVALHWPMRAGAPRWVTRLLTLFLSPVLLLIWLFGLVLLLPLFLLDQKWLASPAARSGARQKKIAEQAAAFLQRQFSAKV